MRIKINSRHGENCPVCHRFLTVFCLHLRRRLCRTALFVNFKLWQILIWHNTQKYQKHRSSSICLNFSDDLKGLMKVWILGDNFLVETYRKNFRKAGNEFFLKENFEVVPFCSSKYSDRNVNMLSRIINSFISAVNNKIYLPAYLIILLDDDLIDYLQYKKFGVSTLYGNWLEFLAGNIQMTLEKARDELPNFAKAAEKTQVYWVEPPNHIEFTSEDKQMREKFSHCLEALTKIYNDMRVLKISTPLCKEDSNLVINNRFTKMGLA